MAAEELVEAVDPGQVDREAVASAARPSPHLPQARDRAGEADADRRVELADVDPELERVGRDDREQIAGAQPRLDLAPLLWRVAGPVGSDPVGQVPAAALGQLVAGEALDQLDPAAAADEADRPRPGEGELGEHVGGLGERRAAGAGAAVEQRRVPDRDPPTGPRGAVGVDEVERRADQALGELLGVGDRRRGEDEARLGAVDRGDPAQPAQDVGDVGAEDAAVDVRLVDDDVAEPRQHLAPVLVVGQDADVEHVGVGQDQVGAAPDRGALLARRVAVVDRVPEAAGGDLDELARLVLGQRLGRVEVERPRVRVAGDRVEHRHVEGERLARRGAAGDDHVLGLGSRAAPRAGARRACVTPLRSSASRRSAVELRRAAGPRSPRPRARRSRRRGGRPRGPGRWRRARPRRSPSPRAGRAPARPRSARGSVPRGRLAAELLGDPQLVADLDPAAERGDHLDEVPGLGDVVAADHARPLGDRPAHGGEGAGQPLPRAAVGDRTDEVLARDAPTSAVARARRASPDRPSARRSGAASCRSRPRDRARSPPRPPRPRPGRRSGSPATPGRRRRCRPGSRPAPSAPASAAWSCA